MKPLRLPRLRRGICGDEMKDAIGRTVSVGDTIAYGTRHGSSLSMNIGIVSEVVKRPKKYYEKEDGEFLRVKVVVSSDYVFTYGRYNSETGKRDRVTERNVTIRVSSNMIVVNGADVSAIVAAQAETQRSKQ